MLNSLAWYNLRDLRSKKVIIISESTRKTLDDARYLHEDVAHICMPGAAIQQRAALLKKLHRKTMQINPITILSAVMDHLDEEGHLATLTKENATLQQIEAAAMSIYKVLMHARAALKDDWQRVLALPGPGYKQWPEGVQKATAAAALMYRAIEFMIFAGDTVVNEDRRESML